jgi:hypothetical protein
MERHMNRTVRIILGIVVLLLVAGGSFFGGTLYGESRAQTAFTSRRQGALGTLPGANGTPGPGGAVMIQRGGQGGGVFGQIKEIAAGSMIITDSNGKETRVTVTDTTLIEKQASVQLSDLTAGETVIVSGSQGADGSITARSVQVATAGRFGMGGPGATPVP